MAGVFFPRRPGQAPRDARGVYRAVVTRVVGGHPYVEIPRLARGREFGPLDILQGMWTPNAATEPSGEEAHMHGLGADLAPGDRVLVGFIEGSVDDPVVLGRLT